MTATRSPWWRTAVFYEIYVRSYADSSGDGVGDLRGIAGRLDHLVGLGVDALWLTPFYPSPMADHGYDVSDPRGVEPRFGDLADFDALLAGAHDRGLRLTVDVVPNHVSDQHPWFIDALTSEPGSSARERFIFRAGRGSEGQEPPNNWRSTFGGSAWTRVADGEWFLHLFTPEQPDLNWRNPEVGDDFERTLRFWLDRGVDGFRIDVAHGLFKAVDLPDNPAGVEPDLMSETTAPTGMWNQPEVHGVYRRWHSICAEYDHEPMLVGEVWIGDATQQALYVRADELSLAFNFRLLFSAWAAAEIRDAIERSTTALRAVGASSTWVLSNHDVVRHVTRYGGGQPGRRRARAALLLMLALPGTVFLYQGEELGLEEVELPDDALQDPIWESSGHTDRGRDGCRVPLPWSGEEPSYGFSASPTTWLPQPTTWAAETAAVQAEAPDSMMSLYRLAISRRPRRLDVLAALEWHDANGADVLDFSTVGPDAVRCIVNFGTGPIRLPTGEVVLRSAGADDDALGPDEAIWLRP